ncbi:MAG: choice-of-anchor D domain-containing protein [Longimonas sp.]|uniref:choice-of-anchor D domain-containing protein n=1 Tax=Longimonas sp. TaxID=2039626 RepID=UPI0033542997
MNTNTLHKNTSLCSAPHRSPIGLWIATAVLGLLLIGTVTACGSTDANDENGDPPPEEPAPEAVFAVDPGSIDYGDVDTEETEEAVITITNDGDATLEGDIDIEDGAAHFSASETGSYEVTAGSSLEVTVTFAPEDEEELEGMLSITHNADNTSSPAEVSLSGTGIVELADPPDRP